MSKIAGVDVLLKVRDGNTNDLVVVGGQTGASLNRSAETIDVTDKTSDGWSTAIAGIKSWSIDAEGFVSLGNDGQGMLEEAFDARQTVHAEIRLGDADDSDGITYTGECVITDLSNEFSQDDAVTFSVTLEGASPLTRTVGTNVI